MAVIEVVEVHKRFWVGSEERAVLDGVSLVVEAGESVAICGPSGSGKSTLLHVLGALDTPTQGEVYVQGEALSTRSERDRAVLRRERLGFVFQHFHLLATLSAAENVALPLLLAGRSEREALCRAGEVLELVGLAHRRSDRVGTLSGGEQQRTAIGRALVADPAVVLADEPTGALDSATSSEVVELLLAMTVEAGRSLVVVTHSQAVARAASRTVELVDGHLTAATAPTP